MHKIVYIIVVISIAIGCQNPSDSNTNREGEEIQIPTPLDITIEELISEYDTIRLESSDLALLSGILQIHTMNKKLYITESTMSIVFIYSEHGKYISKICNQGGGPEEYIKIGSFETDPANNRLLISDNFSKRLFEYDENGTLLQVIPLNFNPLRITSDISKRYIHLNSTTEEEYSMNQMKKNNVHIISDKGEIAETFLKDDTPNRLDILSACAASYTEEGELLYMPVLSNTIYRLHDSKAIPEYTLNNQSGSKTVTAKVKKELYFQYDHNNLEEAEKNGYLITCGSFLNSDSLTFLDLGWNQNLYTYYSKSDKCAITISPDKLKGNKGLCEVFSAHPKAITGNFLYIGVPPQEIQYVLPLLPESKLKTFFEAMTESDNPCVIKFRLNKKLFTNKAELK